MIALRPMHGKLGRMSYTVLEGRVIPDQILKLLKGSKLEKDGYIVKDIATYNKAKADEKAKALEAEKKGNANRDKMIKEREAKKHKKPEELPPETSGDSEE